MTEHAQAVLKIIATAAAGAVLGWSANALTLGGRVDAVEKSMQRLETLMGRILEAKAAGK